MFFVWDSTIREIVMSDSNVRWVAEHFGVAVFGVTFGYESSFDMFHGPRLRMSGVNYSVVSDTDRYRYVNIVY